MDFWIKVKELHIYKLHIRAKGKEKGKVQPRTGHEGQEGEKRYSSTLSLTWALDGVGGQRHARFTPGKDEVTIV